MAKWLHLRDKKMPLLASILRSELEQSFQPRADHSVFTKALDPLTAPTDVGAHLPYFTARLNKN